jgi:hypothetical protein
MVDLIDLQSGFLIPLIIWRVLEIFRKSWIPGNKKPSNKILHLNETSKSIRFKKINFFLIFNLHTQNGKKIKNIKYNLKVCKISSSSS